jgi:hypothetical protein
MAIPMITAGDESVPRGQSRLASGLFTVSNTDDTEVTLYEFWDSGTAESSGYFSINGIAQPSDALIAIEGGLLNLVEFVGGSIAGAETVWVRAQVGGEFSDWVSWSIATTGAAPVASAVDGSAHANQIVAASDFFSVNVAGGDPIVSYEFWDSGTGADSGYFAVDGLARAANGSIVVAATHLGAVTYVGGTANGSETVWVRAADPSGWGEWVSWTMITGNTTPVISAPNATLARNQSVDVTTLFSTFDAEGDEIAAYEFWDDGLGANSGRFRISGTPQGQNVAIAVDPAQVANTTFVAGTVTGAETLWVRAHDGFAWGAWKSFVVTTANQVPTVNASNASVVRNAQALASALFSVTDADGDAITAYEFWDSGTGSASGYFTVNGVTQAANTSVPVSAANLANTRYVGGNGPGSETVWVRVNDGTDWSTWVSWSMTTTGSAPVVTASNRGVHTNQSVLGSSLFSVNDPDADAIVSYEFWDSGTGASSGHFTIGVVPQAQNVAIPTSAANLDQVSYAGGSVDGSETVWVRAEDATGFGAWVSWNMTTGNSTPVISASNASVGTNAPVLASSLFSVNDFERDTITQYEFWDSGTAPDSGHFTIAGMMQGSNTAISVAPGQLGQTNYVGGSVLGAEQVWVRANDGADWGQWASWMMATVA